MLLVRFYHRHKRMNGVGVVKIKDSHKDDSFCSAELVLLTFHFDELLNALSTKNIIILIQIVWRWRQGYLKTCANKNKMAKYVQCWKVTQCATL